MTHESDTDLGFSYKPTKNGRLFIYCKGKLAKTLNGHRASKFLLKVSGLGANDAQLLMARETGQFKFGNEKNSVSK
jgi:hypothetical protein